ncbi:MAG: Rossman fold protein, TIGR00730 family [Bacteroidetes bacterium 46-16]|nr:MAG: Rossman fold protein, TIGR00730 family [Bacteroidetes bacterium 46-16]
MEENQNGRQREFTPVGSKKEAQFLEGPHARTSEGVFLLQVIREFIRGFRKLHFVGPCITVFGSARFKEGHQYYEMARKLGAEMASLGFTVMTGGGPGVMEAANRGAKEAGGRSIGCNIILPQEQKPNPYLDRWVDIDFFFVRKVLLTKYSYGFIVMPGGYGTMDEFFESLTLIQTAKILKFPVALVGTAFHQDLYKYLQQLVVAKTIDQADLELFLFTDSTDEVVDHFVKYAIDGFGLKKLHKVKPLGVLGESKPKASRKDLKKKVEK